MTQIPELKLNPMPDLTHHTYNQIQVPKTLNTTDLLAIEVRNSDGKLLEYSCHPIGIRCIINNNFSVIHGGKLQLKILDPNTNNECFIDVTGETKNTIVKMITN